MKHITQREVVFFRWFYNKAQATNVSIYVAFPEQVSKLSSEQRGRKKGEKKELIQKHF